MAAVLYGVALHEFVKMDFTGQAECWQKQNSRVAAHVTGHQPSLPLLPQCEWLLGLGGVARAHWAEPPGSKGQANDSTGAGALNHWLCTAPRG